MSIAFRPMNINGTIVPPQTSINRQYQYQPPVGMTAESIQRQVNENAMKTIGYQPPPVPPSDPFARHQYIASQAAQTQQSKQAKQLAEIMSILQEDLPELLSTAEIQRLSDTRDYRITFEELLKMKSGEVPFSLKDAVFMIENAWNENKLSYVEYCKQIAVKVKAINMLSDKEQISSGNLGKNYLIQKLFSERIVEYKGDVVNRVHKPFQYDFEDYLAENDWSKMFVTKLLQTGKGQCHSMPLLYLILAHELHAESWLSLAPEHSFIVFRDDATNTFYNFETTNGSAVSTDWLMESGYINTQAIRNRLYLDTLSKTQLIGTLTADLIMGYTNKFGYDDFVVTMVDSLISMHPKSVQGLMLKADLLMLKTQASLKRVGNPPLTQIHQFPDANANYSALLSQYELIDNLGYVPMPSSIYDAWLRNLNSEKRNIEKQKIKTQIISNAKKSN